MKKSALCVIAVLFFTLCFTSCDDIFSTPLGGKFGDSSFVASREYDSAKIDVNEDNLHLWLERAKGNPALAAAVNDKIVSITRDKPIAETAKMVAGSVKMAAESTGLGQSILSNAASVLTSFVDGGEGMEDPMEVFGDILGKILDDFKANDGVEKAKGMASMLIDSHAVVTNGTTPGFAQSFIDELKPEDVSEVIMVLLVSAVADVNFSDPAEELEKLMENFSFEGIGEGETLSVSLVGNPSPTFVVMAAFVNTAASNPSIFGGDFLIDALMGMFK